jgi:hypothetical protein
MSTPVIDGSGREESARGETPRRPQREDVNIQLVSSSPRSLRQVRRALWQALGGVPCDQGPAEVRVASRTEVRRHVHNILGGGGMSAGTGE